MKQTAVEWLEEKINELLELYPSEQLFINDYFKQAKEMEKRQIIDACNLDKRNFENAEQYYNDTFKSK